MALPKVGNMAPAFTLVNQDGKSLTQRFQGQE